MPIACHQEMTPLGGFCRQEGAGVTQAGAQRGCGEGHWALRALWHGCWPGGDRGGQGK